MRGSSVQAQLIAGALLLAALSPALDAQQAPAAASQSDTTRAQIEAFERSLRGAIEAAAGQLGARVREAFPGSDFTFQFQAQTIVTSWVMPDAGPTFHVLIPAIDGLSLQVYAMNARRPAQRVVSTGGVVTEDPMKPGPTAPITNPDAEYTALARQSLIDTLLDQALTVPVPADQFLTIIAGELPSQPLSPFQQRSRMLILQIKGADLTALRLKSISREDAKARIKESKYPN